MADPPDPPEYRLIDLGPDEQSIAHGLNDLGQVVGEVDDDGLRGFVWLPTGDYELGAGFHLLVDIFPPDPLQVEKERANDINNDGLVVGFFAATVTPDGHAMLWDLDNEEVWSITSDAQGVAIAEGPDPDVVVQGLVSPGPQEGVAWRCPPFDDPIICEHLQVVDEPLGGADFDRSRGFGVNSESIVVGSSIVGPNEPHDHTASTERGTYWPASETAGEPLPPKFNGLMEMRAVGRDINETNEVIGSVWDPGHIDHPERAAYWVNVNNDPNLNVTPVLLPSLPGQEDDPTRANALTEPFDDGRIEVVGQNAFIASAVLWRSTGDPNDQANWDVFDLDAGLTDGMICHDGSWVELREATDINNNGWIVGYGRKEGIAEDRAFVLVPHCPGDLVSQDSHVPDGVVDLQDLLHLLGEWGPCNVLCCPADLNGDGQVNVEDLLILLENWGTCPGYPEQPVKPLSDVLNEVGLNMDDWDDYIDTLENGTGSEQENANCWMYTYLTQCQTCASCPDRDPFSD